MYFFITDTSVTIIDPLTSNIHSFEPANGLTPILRRLIKKNDEEKLKIVINLFNYVLENKVECDEEGVITLTLNNNNNKITFEKEDSTPLLNLIKLLKEHNIIIDDIEEVKPFLKNIAKNTHINALEEVYRYCSNKDFEITEDGCILAYKAVNSNLTSIYDNFTKHALNQYTEEKDFDTNSNNLCSKGLHFCSYRYLKDMYGNYSEKYKFLIVKVNPKDIVAIPKDYGNTKGRCSKYKVLKILNFEDLKKFDEVSTENIQKITPIVRPTKDKLRVSDINALLTLRWFDNDIEKAAEYLKICPETLKRIQRRYNAVKGKTREDKKKLIPFPGELKYVKQGECTCSTADNYYGKGINELGPEQGWVITSDCPAHGWEDSK